MIATPINYLREEEIRVIFSLTALTLLTIY